MLNIKKALTNLMNQSTIDLTERKIDWNTTVPANGSTNTNLKTLIDTDLPSGYKYVAISGYSTNDIYLSLASVRYYNGAYSLQVSNRYNSSRTSKIEIAYLCAKVGGVVSRLLNALATAFVRKGVAVC